MDWTGKDPPVYLEVVRAGLLSVVACLALGIVFPGFRNGLIVFVVSTLVAVNWWLYLTGRLQEISFGRALVIGVAIAVLLAFIFVSPSLVIRLLT